MKKTTFLIVIVLSLLVACKNEKVFTRNELVRQSAEKYLFTKLNDTTKYEFVSIKLTDSILYKDNIAYRKERFGDTSFEESQLQYDREKYQAQIDNKKLVLSKIDSIEAVLGERVNEIAAYNYFFSFRSSNKLGAIVLGEYILQVGPPPNYEVLNITDNPDKVFLNPNDFPGYREMIKKNL